MGQYFGNSRTGNVMYLTSEVIDRYVLETDNPVPFHFLRFNPYDDDVFFGRWPTRDKLFGGAGFQDSCVNGNPWMDIIPTEVTGRAGFTYRIVGTVVNNIGTPVAGLTCTLYKTADKSVQGVTTTNEFGQYGFGVPDASTQFYIIASQESPALFAGSVNTLVGSL
jgi:hypothetical protein